MATRQQNPETMVAVKTQTNVGQKIAIAIGVLGFLGGVVGASLALAPGGGTATKPSAPTLLSPTNGATGVGVATAAPPYLTALLDWTDSARATSYKVYFGPSATPPLVATISALVVADDSADSSRYTVSNLNTETLYYWKIQACNRYGCVNSTPASFSFTSMTQFAWFDAVANPTVGFGSAACGGQRACDAQDPTNVLDCAEFGRIWLACNSFTNKCPEDLSGKCMEQSACQCNGKAPGAQECVDYIATLSNPC